MSKEEDDHIRKVVTDQMVQDYIEKTTLRTAPTIKDNLLNQLSLRDYFAGQALMGIVASNQPAVERYTQERIADLSYKLADAMLTQRSKP